MGVQTVKGFLLALHVLYVSFKMVSALLDLRDFTKISELEFSGFTFKTGPRFPVGRVGGGASLPRPT